MKRLITTLKILAMITLLSAFSTGCDKVNDEAPSISTLDVGYAKKNSPLLIPVYGDFTKENIDVITSSPSISRIETENDDRIYLKYEAEAPIDELVDINVINNGTKLATGSIAIVAYNEGDCVDSGFSDDYVVEQGSSLEVDLMQNDAFCDFANTGKGGVRVEDVTSYEGEDWLISITSSSAILTYTPSEDFVGKISFIYELCYGWEDEDDVGERIWTNPTKKCRYYYGALATIEVVEKQ